jgi:hypothetical protein
MKNSAETKQLGPTWLVGRRLATVRARRVVVAVPWNSWRVILDAVIPRGLEAEKDRKVWNVNHRTAAGGPGYELHRAFRDPEWSNGGGCLYAHWAREFGQHLRDAHQAGELEGVPQEQINEILSMCDTGHAIDFQSWPPETSGRQGKKYRHLRVVK